jgi:N-acetylmuramoyl-L-alanine amidase
MWAIDKGVLRIDGRPVEQIPSRNTGGAFAATPHIVVMHFTAGGSARTSAQWFASARNTQSSAHVVIERDGTVIQCVDFGKVAWHAGKSSWHGLSGLNQYAIGVEMANWGYLQAQNGLWVNGAEKPIADPVMAMHRNGNPDGSTHPIGWEPYPAAQFEAAVKVVNALKTAYGIKEIVGHDDIAPRRKSDPGPAFDMARFRKLVLG